MENKICPICRDTLLLPVVLQCGHFFCFDCLVSYVDSRNLKIDYCPVCRSEFLADHFSTLSMETQGVKIYKRHTTPRTPSLFIFLPFIIYLSLFFVGKTILLLFVTFIILSYKRNT